ncbi:MAG: SDH family Clp fold serine proteinase [Pseudomonadota bacterium]
MGEEQQNQDVAASEPKQARSKSQKNRTVRRVHDVDLDMPALASRKQKIIALEQARETRVITYITSTRPNSETQMALDTVRYVFEHLELIKKSNRKQKPHIDLFIHSNGGDGTVPWRLVTLIREYCDKFSVLVPYRAFSAATLTSLGADEIVMHPMGMLGPTDATVTNAFNPMINNQRVGISVEDVTAYLQLVKEDAGIHHEDELVQAFNILASQVHPLALGNVKRSISQSRMMATKLLGLHMPDHQQHKVAEIVDNLTSKLFYHGHPISRDEAREHLGIATVKNATAAEEKAMWDLYLQYENAMKLTSSFDLMLEYTSKIDVAGLKPGAMEKTPPAERLLACTESTMASYRAAESYVLGGVLPANGGPLGVQFMPTKRGWIRCAEWNKLK